MVDVLSQDYWSGVHAAHKLPQSIKPRRYPDEDRLFQKYLPRGGSLFEIGCAPGRWLSYFAKRFDMEVGGVEYVPEAAALTTENLRVQDIHSRVICEDFFNADFSEAAYDLAYSRGFIEHFDDTPGVVARIASLTRPGGYVVTTVPNMEGYYGWLFKKFAPKVYAGHVVIDQHRLREVHEMAGLETVFCNYGGVPNFYIPRDQDSPAPKGLTLKLERIMSKLINAAGPRLAGLIRWVPRNKTISPTVLYIGRRPNS